MHRVSDTLRAAETQDGAVVLEMRQGKMFSLNVVGSRILELLKTGSSESDIADEISRQFEVSQDIAREDLREFLQALVKNNLIEELA